MSEPLPVEIVVTSGMGGSTTYDFPGRKLGNWRWLGLLPLGIGCGIIGFVIFQAARFVGGLIQIIGPWAGLGALFALPFLAGGLTAIGIGLAVLMGRARLCVTDRHLISIEKVGWFSWKRRIVRSDVARLRVHAGLSGKVNGEPRKFAASEEFAVLTAELTRGKSQLLVPGYPREWLVALANALSAQLAVDSTSTDASVPAVPVEVLDATPVAEGEIERFEPPAGTPITHQSLDYGCVFTVPAPGVWKGSSGLFFFSLLWCGFMVVFTTFFGFAAANGKVVDREAWWMFPLFITVFWAAGIGMLLGAINMGRRQAAIAVTNGRMKSIVSGLFGTTRKEWELAELETVRKGPSGMEVNDVPVMQLHIVPRTGAKYGLLTGRDEAELEWMATHLRRYLARPRATAAPDDETE